MILGNKSDNNKCLKLQITGRTIYCKLEARVYSERGHLWTEIGYEQPA